MAGILKKKQDQKNETYSTSSASASPAIVCGTGSPAAARRCKRPGPEHRNNHPTYSDAVYHGVECDDYDYGTAEVYLRAGDSNDASVNRLASIFYGDFPCVFWPEDGAAPGQPTPLTASGIPTLVMVGTADPATPPANAYRIADRLADGYLVVEQGGPHVIFG